MLRRDYNDYLYRMTVERIAHGRTSHEASTLLLQKARATVERSRLQTQEHQPTLQQIWCDVAAVEPPALKADGRKDPTDLMEIVSGRIFHGETVSLDGKHFVDCTLRDCVLEYGGFPVVLETTDFSGCRLPLQGQAAMTVRLLETLGYLDRPEAELPEGSASAPLAAPRPN